MASTSIDESVQVHATTSPPPPPERPLLVAAVALLVFLAGLLWFVVGVTGLLRAAGLPSINVVSYLNQIPTFVGLTGQVSAALETVIGLLVMIISVGLWRTRQWALVITLVFLLVQLIVFGLAHAFETITFVLALVLFVGLIAYSRAFH